MLVDQNTKVMIQGITGKEGSRAAKSMLEYGTKLVCGITPGKGGMKVEGLPVFNSIKEAKEYDSEITTTVLFVPPLRVYGAAIEAMDNGLKTLVIITENMPIKDTAKLIAYAEKKACRIIGPSSVGVLNVGAAKLGAIGGSKYSKGSIGIISKSGGMCSETAAILTQQGLGQSTVVGIGGDVLIGTTFTDLLALFEYDSKTKAVVLYGEIGGTYEEQAAEMVKSKKFNKPLVAFICGKFAESIPRSLAFGHAGAIIEKGIGKAEDKKRILRKAGVSVADYHHEIPDLVKKGLKRWNSKLK